MPPNVCASIQSLKSDLHVIQSLVSDEGVNVSDISGVFYNLLIRASRISAMPKSRVEAFVGDVKDKIRLRSLNRSEIAGLCNGLLTIVKECQDSNNLDVPPPPPPTESSTQPATSQPSSKDSRPVVGKSSSTSSLTETPEQSKLCPQTANMERRRSSNTPSGPPVAVQGTNKKIYRIRGTNFEVDSHYEVIKAIGIGAYGLVCSAVDNRTNRQVAIKKVASIFTDLYDCRRILREIKLLKMLKHENVLRIHEVLTPRENVDTFKDLYLVTELMDADLTRVIKCRQQLSPAHVRYFAYQIVRGLRYIHSAGIIHRDLKPGNLLVNAKSCDLKICDFGLARGGVDPANTDSDLTSYVVTRWYRPPELLLNQPYSSAVDMWSAGCVLAELATGNPLFNGKDYINQLMRICESVKVPPVDQLHLVGKGVAENLARVLDVAAKNRKPLPALLAGCNDDLLDLICRLLTFNPADRLTAEQAMKHKYFEELYSPDDDMTWKPLATRKKSSTLTPPQPASSACRYSAGGSYWACDAQIPQECSLRPQLWEEITTLTMDDSIRMSCPSSPVQKAF